MDRHRELYRTYRAAVSYFWVIQLIRLVAQAVNNLLHSRTSSILRTLISTTLSLPYPTALPSDISAHAIISLTGHGHKTEPLEPVADLLLKMVGDELQNQGGKEEKDWSRLVVALKLASCLIGVRNGSRTPRKSRFRWFPVEDIH